MKKSNCLFKLVVFAFVLFLAAPAIAAEITPKRVVEQVDKAIQLIEDKGEAEAFPLLTDPNGEWVDGDLYPFIYDFNGNIVGHPNKKLVGKNLMKIKDVKGNIFAADFVRVAKSDKGEGWCEYWWPKPGQKEASLKVAFIRRIPGKNMLVGVGVYDITLEEAQKESGR